MGATFTKSGRSPIAGSHKLPDHWEHKDLLILHGTKADDPVVRLCIRGKAVGSEWSVDMKTREADRFARCIFKIAGYDVPGGAGINVIYMPQGDHWSVCRVRGRSGTQNVISIYNHGAPVSCYAKHYLSIPRAVALAEWLAPRLGWDLSTSCAA